MSSTSQRYHNNLLLNHDFPVQPAQPNPAPAPEPTPETKHPTITPNPLSNQKDPSPNPSKNPTTMPSKLPSTYHDRENERAEQQSLFDDCFSPPNPNNIPCANVLFDHAPSEYRSPPEKYFFGLPPLLLHHLSIADTLFRHIPPPSDPSNTHEFSPQNTLPPK
mmetsp:Transcript_48023/g.93810  ORF Transcript_48023/g.93810 Transcript_48023/m.93810 type:complete len:163 (+) Transcript_48023:344-832(+)